MHPPNKRSVDLNEVVEEVIINYNMIINLSLIPKSRLNVNNINVSHMFLQLYLKFKLLTLKRFASVL